MFSMGMETLRDGHPLALRWLSGLNSGLNSPLNLFVGEISAMFEKLADYIKKYLYFSYFSTKTYAEALLMSIHNKFSSRILNYFPDTLSYLDLWIAVSRQS